LQAYSFADFSEGIRVRVLLQFPCHADPTLRPVWLTQRKHQRSEMYGQRENVWLRGDVDSLSAMANETAAAYPEVHREMTLNAT
jgi:hypothetical protein